MKLQKRKIFALFGLSGISLIAATTIGGAFIYSSPDGIKKFRAWQIGGEYLGCDDVALQDKHNNCGLAALKMVFEHHGIALTLFEIEAYTGLSEKGSSMLALKEIAEMNGLHVQGLRYTVEDFFHVPTPAIVFVHGDHFAVVDSITEQDEVFMRDPAIGKIKLPLRKFSKIWQGETLIFWRK